ncbi:histidine--tRNA ligase [Geotoga petraea]|uniref:Histidine--tRNA ligase n=1 Tax=Geotoga petraea TaxID=28234 RepID=A0A1G6HXF5_9BACT|nr:histidine--tRNA ligase [Geotoga petraea]MDK2945349.1 histidyl-tRNA synthetase [Geotoga sp.]TGG89010.1 histidine--tRNA ligase [Geotoga petraea]SDB98952.1 histidyl-tRNA synthetase [Geotoga petraea]
MKYSKIKGTQDIFGDDIKYWNFLEKNLREILIKYGYHEIRTPIFENTELFYRSIGENTDVVQKEMYTFKDKGERSITLRPEGTAPTVRAYVENSMINFGQPYKLFYIGPMFRYEKPQSGRYRQFHQAGAEIFGTDFPVADAEVIAMLDKFFKKIGLREYSIKINSIGSLESRNKYREVLKEYYSDKIDNMCDDCKRRYNTNIMRLLDCKVDKEYSKDAPSILDSLTDEDKEHFENVKSFLDSFEVEYEIDSSIVRGLDYYNLTAFEVEHNKLGAQSVIAGGGRYDGLVKELGGPNTPAIGFGIGIERVILAIKEEKIEINNPEEVDVYIAYIGKKSAKTAIEIANILRDRGIKTYLNISKRNVSGQLKHANKVNAKFSVIFGNEEIEKDIVTFRDMESGEQTQVERSWFVDLIIEKLNNR